jgi:hypothetical protein
VKESAMLRKWWKVAAVVLVGAIALGVWQFRVSWVVTADGQLQWTGESSPPSWEIVWTGAEQVESLLPTAEASTQMISPRLADQGTTLYFTLRREGGQSDLYFAERDGAGWKSARPLDVLNTAADELGPTLSTDGQTIWFYSNRKGGVGGYDLYSANRDGAGWSVPQNAGPEINSVAHEYDPALSPNGQTLFFTSNRTDDIQAAVETAQTQNAPWETTLRARLSSAKFDLYRAARDTSGDWQTATPLASLNRPRSNEGAPFVSPDGAYLYFASDRPARAGEDTNLDVYRSRFVSGQPGEAENLGPTINSEFHETEPALSAEGFTLIFSSDRDGVDRIYRSRAQEVFHQNGWAIPVAPQWLTGVWLKALGLTLIIAGLLGAVMYWRGLFGERAYQARFFLSSLALHFLLLAILGWWTLPQVYEVIMTELQEAGPALSPFEDTGDTANPDPREAYEKVEDLAPVQDAAPMQPVARPAIAQRQPQPTEPVENPLPDLPQTVTHAVNPDRVAYVPIKQTPPKVEQPEVKRDMTPLLTELVTIEELPELAPADEPVPEQPAAQAKPVDIARQDTAPQRPELPQRQTPTQIMKLTATVAELAEPTFEETPTVELPTTQPRPQRQQPAVQLAQADLSELPDLANPEAAQMTPAQPRQVATELNRAAATAPNINSPMPVESVAKLPGLTGPQPATSTVTVANVSPEMPAATTPQARPQFERTMPEPVEVAGLAVSEEALSPEITQADSAGALVAVDASVARNTPVSPKAGSPMSAVLDSPATSQPAAAVSVAVAQRPTEIDIRTPAELIQRRGPAAPLLAEVADAELAALEKTESLDGQLAMLEQVNVAVERRSEVTPTSATQSPLNRTIELVPDLTVASVDAQQRPTVRESEFAIERPLNESVRRSSVDPFEVAVAAAIEVELAEALPATAPTMEKGSSENASLQRTDQPRVEVASQPFTLARSTVSARSVEVAVATTGSLNTLLPDPTVPSDGLTRDALHPMTLAASQDTVELRSMFTLRKAENRRNLIDLLGGTPQSEQAVNRGLEWLAKVQEEDGSWSLKKHQGQVESHCAGTGFGLLPFLAAGHTHNRPGKYQHVVQKALDWMRANQQADGNLMLLTEDQHHQMYSHGISSIALCEAYGVSNDDKLREPAQKALDFIVKAQHSGGGWRYRPGEAGDTSVVGWQMMALKSGEMAGLKIPAATYAGVDKWLKFVEDKNNPGRFGYVNRSANLTMTAEGLLCLQFLGTSRNDSRMRKAADWLIKELPEEQQKRTSYYWYYSTQVMYHMQGDYWEQWNGRLRDMLVKTQKQAGNNGGSWDPRDNWDQKGGRIMATSLKLLMLEVYYRHLPLYDQLDD